MQYDSDTNSESKQPDEHTEMTELETDNCDEDQHKLDNVPLSGVYFQRFKDKGMKGKIDSILQPTRCSCYKSV